MTGTRRLAERRDGCTTKTTNKSECIDEGSTETAREMQRRRRFRFWRSDDHSPYHQLSIDETVEYKSSCFIAWDVGGQNKIRGRAALRYYNNQRTYDPFCVR